MRTLLNEPFPPECQNQENFSCAAEKASETARIFPAGAVLASKDDLVEVGVGGTVIATPGGLWAESAPSAPERGVAISTLETQEAPLPCATQLCPVSPNQSQSETT